MDAVASGSSPRIVFAGTAAFAVPILEGLVEAGYSVTAVITQPDRPQGRGQQMQAPPVKVRALELGLQVHQPLKLKDEEARQLFQKLAPDLLVVVAYGKILPRWLIELPRYGPINLHGSLLPRYRGAAPIQWAMANGETETGVCAMRIDEGLDTGPVYGCTATSIDPDESVLQLSDRLALLGKDLMNRTIAGLLDGTVQATPQDHSRATLAPMLTKEDGVIDWNLPARTIHNRIRAFKPWPGARTGFRDGVCRVLRSRVNGATAESNPPGTLLVGEPAEKRVSAVCGDGVLLDLLEVQLPNRKAQSGADFVNGSRVATGEKFHRPESGVADNSSRG